MKLSKRILLFVAVNILIVGVISIVLGAFGISPTLGGRELLVSHLAAFCLVWGFGASLISLALSRVMARWMMGVRLIEPGTRDPAERELVETVHEFARRSGIATPPQVGVYESPELNAFATGPTRNRALVAVSTGLLVRMDRSQLNGVLAHEVAHIANGDMVTMTLIQGVVNAFVMFLARLLAWVAGQFVAEERRPLVQFGLVLVLELGLGLLGMMVAASFSRAREFRADEGGARLAGPESMIAALQKLRATYESGFQELVDDGRASGLASLKISGSAGSFLKMLSTHPELGDRIQRLENLREMGRF